MNPEDIFLPKQADSDTRHRLLTYLEYLKKQQRRLIEPDLDHYQNYLVSECNYAPNTVRAHLRTVSGRYRDMIDASRPFAQLAELTRSAQASGEVRDIHKLLAKAARYTVEDIDVPDELEFDFPSYEWLSEIFHQNLERLQDLRDLLLVALPFCAGLTEAEIVALKVKHLDFSGLRYASEKVLTVPAVHTDETRQIRFYEDKLFTDPWLYRAFELWHEQLAYAFDEYNIADKSLFSGFYKGGMRLRKMPLSVNGYKGAVQRWTETNEGKGKHLTARALRGAFARWIHYKNVSYEEIRDNLGLGRLVYTLNFIGPPNREGESEKIDLIDSSTIPKKLDDLEHFLDRRRMYTD